jgi:hypothetical protein
MKRKTTDPRRAAVATLVSLAIGCGSTGWIRFEKLDSGPPASARTSVATLVRSIDCEDHEVLSEGLASYLVRTPILYVATCTKDGGAIPWKVLGLFHAGTIAFDRWDQYRREVAEKGHARGCPAVLVRAQPPSASTEAEAIGALCVDLARPSEVNGPMRLAFRSRLLSVASFRVLRDGEPTPRAP